MNHLASESLALRVQAERIADLYSQPIGAPSKLGDPDILQHLLAAISDGLSYEDACYSAGIAPRTIYNWKTKAEQGDEGAMAFMHALKKAEADVKRKAIRNTLKAGEFPQFWAANVTYLERKYPGEWGRRQDDNNTPKVVVQIGARDSDITVNVQTNTLSPSVNPDIHSLSASTDTNQSLIIGDYVNQDAQPDQAIAAREPAGGPDGEGRPLTPSATAGEIKGVRGGRKKKG